MGNLRIVVAGNGVQFYVEEMVAKTWKIAKVFYSMDKATVYMKFIGKK